MAYNRKYSGDESVLMACSICGNAFEYPADIRYCESDRLFRCNIFCTEKHLPIDEDRKNGETAKRREEVAPSFKVGTKPSWWP